MFDLFASTYFWIWLVIMEVVFTLFVYFKGVDSYEDIVGFKLLSMIASSALTLYIIAIQDIFYLDNIDYLLRIIGFITSFILINIGLVGFFNRRGTLFRKKMNKRRK